MKKEPYYDQAGWIDVFEKLGCLWMHDGNPNRPHAHLTSNNNHSSGYFNASLLIENILILAKACHDLMLKLPPLQDKNGTVICGSAMGAVTIAYELARQLNSPRAIFTEKTSDGAMAIKRFNVKDANVLMVEDVATTFSTTVKSIAALEAAGAIVLPTVGIIVNRSGMTSIGDGDSSRNVVALIEKELPIWTPDECPLCKADSKAVRPKDNWDLLNATY